MPCDTPHGDDRETTAMLHLTTTPTTTTQPAPTVRMQLTSHSNLAVRGQRAAAAEARHALSLTATELPRDLALSAIRDAAALGYRHLVLEGGEPFLHPHLLDLVTRAERHSLHTTIVTNGTLPRRLRRLDLIAHLADRIVVEFHGLAATHDEAVEREGAFARATANLALLRAAGSTPELRFTLTAANAADLPHFLEFAATHAARAVDVRSTWDGGLGDDDRAQLLADLQPHADALGIALTSDMVAREELILLRGHYVPTPASRQLVAVAPSISIDAFGAVRPSSATLPNHLAIGSLHRGRLPQLAPVWLRSDRPRHFARACDRAWWSAVAPDAPRATRWEDELALHVDTPVARAITAPLAA